MLVRFYLFEKSPERQVDSTCRLCRKILQQQTQARIWLYCPDPSLQKIVDDLLWQFDRNSFIAHAIDDIHSPINISAQLPQHCPDIASLEWIIFNLSDNAFDWQIAHYQVIEIIENDEEKRQIGRIKFTAYKQAGMQVTVYKL